MLKDVLENMHLIFDNIIIERGILCQKQGRILNVRMSEGLIKGRVKGNQSQLYDVHINLRADAEHFARCTCPYTINCKHAAACLFEIQSRRKISVPSQLLENVGVADYVNKPTTDYKEVDNRLASPYVVNYEIEFEQGHRRGIPVRLYRVRKLKSGDRGKPIEIRDERDINSKLSTSDQILAMKLLAPTSLLDRSNNIRDFDTLKQVVASGTAFVLSKSNKTRYRLIWGDPIEATIGWQLNSEGLFCIQLSSDQKSFDAPFLWRVPFCIDKEQHSLHELKSSYSYETLKALMSIAPIPIDKVPHDFKILQQRFKDIPELPKFKVQIKSVSPIVKVIFSAVERNKVLPREDYQDGEFIFFVKIHYLYGGHAVPHSSNSDAVYAQNKNIIEKYNRNFEIEGQNFEKIKSILDLHSPFYTEMHYANQAKRGDYISKACPNENHLNFLFEELVPILRSSGYKVDFNHSIFQRPIDIDELTWFSDLQETDSDKLAYELGVIVEGETINLVPLVIEVIHKFTPQELHKLPDDYRLSLGINHSKAISIDVARIRPLINFILQYGEKKLTNGKILQLEKNQAIWLQEMELAAHAANARWQGAEHFRDQLGKFLTHDFEIDMPKQCLAKLRDYQIKGVSWLQSLRLCHFSGILADDMGLGKTVQTLAHLQIEKEQGRLSKPSLIVAPTSLVVNWYQEAKRFTPDLQVLIYHGADRNHAQIEKYDIVVTTYGLVQRDKDQFLQTDFYYLILDEAQFIKNARAKTTLVVQQIKAMHRLCLTGTPLENHLGELWSLFHFLMPGFLGSIRQFRHFFQHPIEKERSKEHVTALSRRVSPFLLRRTKKEVVKELPEKTIITRMVELSGPQRDLYEAIRMAMEKKVRQAIAERGLNKSQLVVLDALLKMRQVCCDPSLLNEKNASIAKGQSAKLELLEDLLINSIEEGRRILVFSQFTSMLSIIEKRCQLLNLPYLKLTGQTKNRYQLVETFQQGETPLFLISLKAGGTGLNLTAADMVIHYDPWWNPAVEDQATDRTHRIGQINPVFVYRLICAGTVEEAMLTLQDKKRQLVSGVYEESILSKSLDMDTIMNFFQPLAGSS